MVTTSVLFISAEYLLFSYSLVNILFKVFQHCNYFVSTFKILQRFIVLEYCNFFEKYHIKSGINDHCMENYICI